MTGGSKNEEVFTRAAHYINVCKGTFFQTLCLRPYIILPGKSLPGRYGNRVAGPRAIRVGGTLSDGIVLQWSRPPGNVDVRIRCEIHYGKSYRIASIDILRNHHEQWLTGGTDGYIKETIHRLCSGGPLKPAAIHARRH